MGYSHIRLSKNSSNLCMIIIPWVKYRYKHLPMGVANSPDLFQKRTNDLFRGFECIRAYIDDLLILTKVYCTYHILWLQLRLNKLERKRT